MGQKKLDNKEKKIIIFMISLISQIGISMIVPIMLCLFIGITINKYVDMSLVVLIAVLVGCIVAFRNVYMLLKQTYASDLKRENEEIEYFRELENARKRNMADKKKDN